jgi:hypothetical protein
MLSRGRTVPYLPCRLSLCSSLLQNDKPRFSAVSLQLTSNHRVQTHALLLLSLFADCAFTRHLNSTEAINAVISNPQAFVKISDKAEDFPV